MMATVGKRPQRIRLLNGRIKETCAVHEKGRHEAGPFHVRYLLFFYFSTFQRATAYQSTCMLNFAKRADRMAVGAR